MNGPQAELLEELSQILADPRRRVYPVLDGARFDDLPLDLAAAGIAHRSLYRTVQDIELVRAGPWLVDPYHGLDASLNVWGGSPMDGGDLSPIASDTRTAMKANAVETGPMPFHASGGRADPAAQLERVVAINGELPAAVFWIGDASLTEAKLWRHLRTLNMVLLPKEYVEEISEAFRESAHLQGESDPGSAPTPVMFRHVDGNVLAQVLPVMDSAQFSRMFGPATQLIFLAPDNPSLNSGSAVRGAMLPDDALPPKPGLLSLDSGQCEAIVGLRMIALKRSAISEFCERKEASRPSDRRQVVEAFERAEAYGLESKEDIWAFIEMDRKFGRQFEKSDKFSAARAHFEDTQLSAGAKLYLAGAELEGLGKG